MYHNLIRVTFHALGWLSLWTFSTEMGPKMHLWILVVALLLPTHAESFSCNLQQRLPLLCTSHDFEAVVTCWKPNLRNLIFHGHGIGLSGKSSLCVLGVLWVLLLVLVRQNKRAEAKTMQPEGFVLFVSLRVIVYIFKWSSPEVFRNRKLWVTC